MHEFTCVSTHASVGGYWLYVRLILCPEQKMQHLLSMGRLLKLLKKKNKTPRTQLLPLNVVKTTSIYFVSLLSSPAYNPTKILCFELNAGKFPFPQINTGAHCPINNGWRSPVFPDERTWGGGDWEAKRVTCESREAERANELKCQVRAGARPGFPTHQATSPWEGGGAGEVAAPPFPSPSPLRE